MPETFVEVTKVAVGHVIGKGGETIRGIQSETSAKVEIVDGNRVHITGETDEIVKAAEDRVRAIVAAQENPDYEGEVGHRLRAEANAMGDRRSELFNEATAKREAGDHAAANELTEQAKQCGEEMKAKNKEAAAAIIEFNNAAKGKGIDYFDMHGLREEEALEHLKEVVAKLQSLPEGTVTDLELIPGAGHHSAPGAQKLLGATEAYLRENNIEFETVNAGTLSAKVKGTGSEALPIHEENKEVVAPTPAPQKKRKESADGAKHAKLSASAPKKSHIDNKVTKPATTTAAAVVPTGASAKKRVSTTSEKKAVKSVAHAKDHKPLAGKKTKKAAAQPVAAAVEPAQSAEPTVEEQPEVQPDEEPVLEAPQEEPAQEEHVEPKDENEKPAPAAGEDHVEKEEQEPAKQEVNEAAKAPVASGAGGSGTAPAAPAAAASSASPSPAAAATVGQKEAANAQPKKKAEHDAVAFKPAKKNDSKCCCAVM